MYTPSVASFPGSTAQPIDEGDGVENGEDTASGDGTSSVASDGVSTGEGIVGSHLRDDEDGSANGGDGSESDLSFVPEGFGQSALWSYGPSFGGESSATERGQAQAGTPSEETATPPTNVPTADGAPWRLGDEAVVELGRAHVEELEGSGALPAERAEAILGDPDQLARIGTLLEHPDPGSARAVEVLITDVGSSGGLADAHLSARASEGMLDVDEFIALAGDGELLTAVFGELEAARPAEENAAAADALIDAALARREQSLGSVQSFLEGYAGGALQGGDELAALVADPAFVQALEPYLAAAPDGTVANAAAAALLVDRAVGNLAAGRPPGADGGEVFMSRHGLPFVFPPPPEGGGEAPAPVFIGRDGQPLPEDMQTLLGEAAAGDGPIAPDLLHAARALTGQVALSPVEQFVAASYTKGGTDAETFVAQIDDPAFLDDPTTLRAAESLFGTNPEHGKADDFVNKLFLDGHIDQATFIEHSNDAAFLADIDGQIASGSVTYTTANFGQVDQMLGMSEQEISDTLAPGFDIDQGPPPPEQIVALYEAGGRGDHQFVELAVNYVMYHNPGLELEFGHRTPAESAANDTPLGFFWTRDGEPIEDPFLNSLSAELDGGGGDDSDSEVEEHFHRMRKPYVEGDVEGSAPISVPVRLKFEGVSHDAKDETTDASRHTASLLFPGVDLDDVIGTNGVVSSSGEAVYTNARGHGVDSNGRLTTTFGIDVDDHFTGGADHPGGIDGKARQALEAIDPDLFGTQITQVDGVEGFEVTNETRFDNTVVSADEADGLTVDLQDNSGNYALELSNTADPILNEGAGQGTVYVPPNGQSVIDGYAYADAANIAAVSDGGTVAGTTDVDGTSTDGKNIDGAGTGDADTQEANADDEATSVSGLTFNGGAHSSVSNTSIVLEGDVSDVTINGDDGAQTVHVSGELSDSTINGGGGDDAFFAHAGSTVTGTDILGNDGNDQVVQLEGATFDGVDVQGGDDADYFHFAGHNVDVTADPGRNEDVPDQIEFDDTYSGDVEISDGKGSTYKPKDDDFKDHDLVKLVGDDWIETEDGYAIRNEDGSIRGSVGIAGDADNIEEVGIYDPATGEQVQQLKYIEPEIIMSNSWMSWTSTALKIVGMLPIPGAQVALIAGVAMDAAYKIDNGMTSFGDIAMTAAGAIPGGATGSLIKAGINFGVAAADGELTTEEAIGGAISFVPGEAGHALKAGFRTYQFGDAIASGEDIGGIFSHAGSAIGSYGQALGDGDVVDAGRITYSAGSVYDGVESGDVGQIIAGGSGVYGGVNELTAGEPEQTVPSDYTRSEGGGREIDDGRNVGTDTDADTGTIPPDAYDSHDTYPQGSAFDLREESIEYSYG